MAVDDAGKLIISQQLAVYEQGVSDINVIIGEGQKQIVWHIVPNREMLRQFAPHWSVCPRYKHFDNVEYVLKFLFVELCVPTQTDVANTLRQLAMVLGERPPLKVP